MLRGHKVFLTCGKTSLMRRLSGGSRFNLSADQAQMKTDAQAPLSAPTGTNQTRSSQLRSEDSRLQGNSGTGPR